MEDMKELAEAIHTATCNHNHTDQCGWFYEFKDKEADWERWTHKLYLEKAENLYTTVPPQSPSVLIATIRTLGRL